MALKPGTFLGPFEILSLIGAGGMGEVYKARDTRLNRLVAIKTLPAHLADRPELRERFKREASTLANLKHAHICVLYDIGHQELPAEDFEGSAGFPATPLPSTALRAGGAGQPAPRVPAAGTLPRRTIGIDYLVMEYLEGETLAERLKKGPLPLDQVLRYADELADALTTAHRQSFTHRDIKPANIMLTKEGSKLLDFGLAKLKQEIADAITPPSERPTAPGTLTQQGTLLGTLQYMAPEQVEGKVDDIDGRTDIFGFGAVVYEMATGKKAFEGHTQASVIAAILRGEPPPMSSLQPIVPPALERVVKRCLAKEQDERWQTAFDLWHAIKWIAQDSAQPAPPPPAVPATVAAQPAFTSRRQVLLWSVVSLALVALVGLAVWRLKPTASLTRAATAHFVISLPPGQQLPADFFNFPVLALSPDGTRLAYVARSGNAPQQIYIRTLDSPEAKPLPGTEGAEIPFFSPDGQWLGFFAPDKLEKISISGGSPVTVFDAKGQMGAAGATWGADDTIVFQFFPTGDLWRVSAAGGEPQQLSNTLNPQKGVVGSRWPQFLPDGKDVLFAAGESGARWLNPQLGIYNLRTGERRDLPQGGTFPRYSPTGHLLYVQNGTLMAAPFDSRRLEVTGAQVPVVEGVMQSRSGAAQYSFSDNGTLVYVQGLAAPTGSGTGGVQQQQGTFVWVDRKGTEQPIPAPPHAYHAPRLSPDGRRLAVTMDEQGVQLWIYDMMREALTRFTFEGANVSNSVWTPDGKRLTFGSGTPTNLFWQPADGSGKAERLTTSKYPQSPQSSSPDGQLLVFREQTPAAANDLWLLRLSNPSGSPRQGPKAEPFLRTRFNEAAARFSPDGHWLAYVSNESGRDEVYVQPFPGPGEKLQISTEGGREAVWNPNGRELFFRNRNGDKMMAVDITTQPGFSASKPRMLFEGPYLLYPTSTPNYDVSSDGQRFLMLKASQQQQAATQIHVVLNWFEELKRRVPTK